MDIESFSAFLERKHFFPFLVVDLSFLTRPHEISLKAWKVNTISQAMQSWKVMAKIQGGVCVGTEQGAICVVYEWQEMMSALAAVLCM